MQNKSDAQLLGEYAAQGSEPAFAELVARHTNLVYSAALRQTGSPELAREIAQSVFTDLARKARALAGALSADASLAGWLFRGARFAALKLIRDDYRRQTRERQFMEHFNPAAQAATHSASDWERVAPVLDEAMAELGDADHEAVLLRYFKNQDFHAVGLALGVSDAAAQKRVSRAVERLREFLAKRGVAASASGLLAVIAANAIQAAPAGLSAAIAATALAGTTLITATTATVGKAIAMTTLQKVLIAAALAAAIGTGVHEAGQASTLRAQVQTLRRQQQVPLAELDRLRAERALATSSVQADADELKQLGNERSELLRLRGEVGVLRQQLAEAKQRGAQVVSNTNDLANGWTVGEIKPMAALKDAGLGSPLAAVETFWWAAANNNFERMRQCIVSTRAPAGRVSDAYAKREAQFNGGLLQSLEDAGVQLTSHTFRWLDNNSTTIEFQMTGSRLLADGTMGKINSGQSLQLLKIGDEWKVVRDEGALHLSIMDDDSEAVAKMMMQMDGKALESLKADPRLPARTLRAYEEMKAKGPQ